MGCPALIRKIHPYQDGANELVRIISSYRQSRPFFWLISFEYRKPKTGEKGVWSIKFSTGMIVITMFGEKLLLKRKHRPTIGAWTWEIPRAFTNILVDAATAKHDPIATMQAIMHNEVESVFAGKVDISDIMLIDEGISEDTGMSAVDSSVYLVKLTGCSVSEDFDKSKNITWKLFSLEEARRSVHDMHSKGALLSLLDKMEFDGLSLGD